MLSEKAIFELANKKYITNKRMQETIMSITNVLEEQNQGTYQFFFKSRQKQLN